MSRTRLSGDVGTHAAQVRQMTAAEAVRGAVAEQRRLTGRDRAVLALLAEHGVLTLEQLARLVGFATRSAAQHRMVTLTRRGVLARFRRHQPVGTQSWRYTLGVLGATLHAASTGQTAPTPSRVAQRALALAESPRLDHQLAVAEVFASLAGHARTHPGCALVEWWSERRATAECGGIVRPDAAGVWAEHGRHVPLWLEVDRGTEPLPRVLDKLTGYRQLADVGLFRPVLFVLPSTVRERHLHAHPGMYPAGPAGGLVVATTATDHLMTAGHGPADAVWLLPGNGRRVRLIELVGGR
jgi:hypothetical protein